MLTATKLDKNSGYALVTGAAGFIGLHTSLMLLNAGWKVVGVDNISDYYDINLKINREKILLRCENFISIRGNIEDDKLLEDLLCQYRPRIIVHLAAQAGVRYSLENPRSYLDTNIRGTFELLEAARLFPPEHLLMASTSSIYGPNTEMPFNENLKSDHQMSFYAATKKAAENLAHSYAHLHSIPITTFRFFTVYGPWGRPDMALFKFTKAIMDDEELDLYNFGDMKRDFTYIDDLVEAIKHLIPNSPDKIPKSQIQIDVKDSKSPVAPYRVVNIGSSHPITLMNFVSEIEHSLNKTGQKNYMPIQAGDVAITWADNRLLASLTGFTPKTDVKTGIKNFINWYLDYYVSPRS